MGMTKTINTFKKLQEVDDVDLKYAVETLHGMYHAALSVVESHQMKFIED